ncbi:MAG: hypothetical protein BMS9Abin37_1560 [Acidobacteriota bacterium]|nr:MAG: hypothetical protein BMS9Abin37_1560 [Acidobacteriota bacterium]
MPQVVDTESAKEFMREALEKVDHEELLGICADVERKSEWFQERLAPDVLDNASTDDYLDLLSRIFATRRKRKEVLERHGLENLRRWSSELLYGESDVKTRFAAFTANIEGFDNTLSRDFASELLHFTDPDRYWLWTRWMWDPRTKTGALPLVTHASYDFGGDNGGDVYMRIGEALAFVHQVGEAAEFQTLSKSIFGTDVFLSSVYVVYVYTVLRMRMTQEFNKVVPGLSEFSRRLLGVHERRH